MEGTPRDIRARNRLAPRNQGGIPQPEGDIIQGDDQNHPTHEDVENQQAQPRHVDDQQAEGDINQGDDQNQAAHEDVENQQAQPHHVEQGGIHEDGEQDGEQDELQQLRDNLRKLQENMEALRVKENDERVHLEREMVVLREGQDLERSRLEIGSRFVTPQDNAIVRDFITASPYTRSLTNLDMSISAKGIAYTRLANFIRTVRDTTILDMIDHGSRGTYLDMIKDLELYSFTGSWLADLKKLLLANAPNSSQHVKDIQNIIQTLNEELVSLEAMRGFLDRQVATVKTELNSLNADIQRMNGVRATLDRHHDLDSYL